MLSGVSPSLSSTYESSIQLNTTAWNGFLLSTDLAVTLPLGSLSGACRRLLTLSSVTQAAHTLQATSSQIAILLSVWQTA